MEGRHCYWGVASIVMARSNSEGGSSLPVRKENLSRGGSGKSVGGVSFSTHPNLLLYLPTTRPLNGSALGKQVAESAERLKAGEVGLWEC